MPPSPSLSHELAVALAAARDAAALVMRVYAADFAVEFKGRNDPVTAADRGANDLIVQHLAREFPGDAICAEEAPTVEASAAAARGGRCWFVDPLDGTREFVAKNGEFCVMIGLAIDGAAQLGVVVAPAWDRTLWGIVGQGAFERASDGVERPLTRVPSIANPTAPHLRMVVSRSHASATLARVATELGITDVRPCGSVGLKVALVASGEADLYVHTGRGPKLWDGCAPEAIARASGANVTDTAGNSLRYDVGHLPLDHGLVIAAPPLHARALHAIGAHG